MWLWLAAGCGVDRGPWEDLTIDAAWFEAFHLTRMDAVVGLADGDAVLGWDGPRGGGSVPVHLGGGGLGLVLDVSIDPEGHDGVVPIDLEDVDDPTVADVLGTYRGTGAQGALGIGGSGRRLRNGRGAAFREGHFVVGVAVFAGFEWIVVREGGNDGLDDAPPAPPVDTGPFDSGGGDPGETADTAATAAPQLDTASGEGASGCGSGRGCRRRDGTGTTETTGGTSTGGTTTGGTASGGTASGGTASGGGSSSGGGGCDSCGGGGGGASCDCDGGTSCDHGPGVPVGLVWAGGVVGLRRRSRRGR